MSFSSTLKATPLVNTARVGQTYPEDSRGVSVAEQREHLRTEQNEVWHTKTPKVFIQGLNFKAKSHERSLKGECLIETP